MLAIWDPYNFLQLLKCIHTNYALRELEFILSLANIYLLSMIILIIIYQ